MGAAEQKVNRFLGVVRPRDMSRGAAQMGDENS